MDKRIERTLQRAREAALDVLAREGLAGFTMEAVAAESGIAKSTLYRHWPDRLTLLADVLDTLNRQPASPAPLRPGELRERVIALIEHLAAVFEGSRISKVMPALIEAAERQAAVATFLHRYSAERRQALVDLLADGVRAGELAPGFDPELAAMVLGGPIFYSRFLCPAPYPRSRVTELVDFVLGM